MSNKNQQKVKPISKTSYVIDFRGEPIGKGSFGQIRRVYDLENPTKKLCCKIISIKDFNHLQSALNELKIIEQLPQNNNLINFEKVKAPELYPMYLRDQMFDFVTDYSKIDMFSLGVILYNLAYKIESHPYVGSLYQLFGNNFQGDQKAHFCKSVNAQKEIVTLPYPPRSEQLLSLIKKLCEKDVNKRMSFNELVQCDYISDIYPQQQIQAPSSFFDSNLYDQTQSILKLTQRQSYRQTIYPQPEISCESEVFMSLQNNNFVYIDDQKNLNSKIIIDDVDDDDISNTSKEIMDMIQEQELQKQLDEIEEENKRQDQQYQETFAIFDRCLYLRQIVFFFDKVYLHLDSFIKVLKNQNGHFNKIQNINALINNLENLKKACIFETHNRNETIYKQLESYYSEDSINKFKSTEEFVKLEKLRSQDEDQINMYVESIQKQDDQTISLTDNLTLMALRRFPEIFEILEQLKEKEHKFEIKRALITFWYVYQVNRHLHSLSFFNMPSFETNPNKFQQYYELTDHYLAIDELKIKLIEALNFLQIQCIINID
ncbi:hypothetical protein ABPG74_004113 [Tetrahymena malaccensis]